MNADDLRIGHGYDVHPYDIRGGRTLVLGGVRFEGSVGLAGHSDADVVAHACTDALLGAAGLGDIGTMFPDTDGEYEGADSLQMLSMAAERAAEAGWLVVNIDCTVVFDAPKLAPHRPEMQKLLSAAASAPVTVKAKRTEGLAGLAGGIQCFAVALMRRA